MRIKPLIYIFLVVLAVFFIPNDIFANKGKIPEEVSHKANAKNGLTPPIEEELSDQTKETTETVRKEATGKIPAERQPVKKGLERAASVKNKPGADKLPEQASDKAEEKVKKAQHSLQGKVPAKIRADKKTAEKPLPVKEGLSEKTPDNNSGSSADKMPNTKKREKADITEKAADSKKPAAEYEPQEKTGNQKQNRHKTTLEADETQQGNKFDNVSQDRSQKKSDRERQQQPYPNPQEKSPIAQIHRTGSYGAPSPVSAGSGDAGGQTTTTLFWKCSLPGNSAVLTSQSQIIEFRSEFIRDQWVNAPPVQPPQTAS